MKKKTKNKLKVSETNEEVKIESLTRVNCKHLDKPRARCSLGNFTRFENVTEDYSSLLILLDDENTTFIHGYYFTERRIFYCMNIDK